MQVQIAKEKCLEEEKVRCEQITLEKQDSDSSVTLPLSLVQVKRDCPNCTYVSPHRAQCLFNTGQTRSGEKHFPQTLQAFWREDREQTAVRILSLGQLYHALSCFIS